MQNEFLKPLSRQKKSAGKFFIVCDNKYGEVSYFKNFETAQSRVEIELLPFLKDAEGDEYETFLKRVERFIEQKDLQKWNRDTTVDRLWFVFNVEDCSTETVSSLEEKINALFQSDYCCNNPNFSIWLYHSKRENHITPFFQSANKIILEEAIASCKIAYISSKDFPNEEKYPPTGGSTVYILIGDLIAFTESMGLWF
jgi:hypothetical protein